MHDILHRDVPSPTAPSNGRVAAAVKPLVNLMRGRPVMAVFEVCLRCNSQCGYCDLPLNVGRYEMTRDEIRRVFEGLYRDGLRYVFVQGGEPTVRRDLPAILEDLARIGFGLCLVTNGTRLSAERVTHLASLGVSVSVSLDTLDRGRYRRIRGADQLPRVLNGVKMLADYPHPKFITCIVSEENRADVPDVARFARRHGFIPVLGAYHWDVGRYGKADADLQFRRQAAVATFEEVRRRNLVPRGYYSRFLDDNIRWLKGERLARCDAGRYSIAIDASGNVAPCLAHGHAGNLREQSLSEILAAMDHAAVRRCSDRSSCNLLCGRIVGANLRAPLTALRTPMTVPPEVPPD